jgi:hypothetical protein
MCDFINIMEQPPPIFRFSTRKQGFLAQDHLKRDATTNPLISYVNAASGGGCAIIPDFMVISFPTLAFAEWQLTTLPNDAGRCRSVAGNAVHAAQWWPKFP